MTEKNSRLKRTGSTDDDERNRIVLYLIVSCNMHVFSFRNFKRYSVIIILYIRRASFAIEIFHNAVYRACGI